MARSINISIVQKTAAYLDIAKSMTLAESIMREAKANGAQLIVFGETWLTGYPAWIDHCLDYARWDDPRTKQVFKKMHANSVCIGGPELDVIKALTMELEVCVCMGLNEIEVPSTGTIYNSVVIIDHGELIFHHRKLMPTFTERLLYGLGEGGGLEAVDSSVGRIGALICWEHWMPLTRQAMHNSGEEIHIALWPNVHEMLQIASRHYAFEGRCFTIAAGQLMYRDQMPEGLNISKESGDLLLNGGSSIIGPNGKFLVEPHYDDSDVINYTIDDLDEIRAEQMALDVSGHYQRPDIFDFNVRSDK